ncbi:MAG: hypothetical protein CME16_05260 [Gemmatimonadetes bacterium]|nr:hypothetical protein [Gemmatimonadota bacterium]
MIIGTVLLLAIPLFLSWATAGKKRQLKDLALLRAEEVKALRAELDILLEESRQSSNNMRRYANKRSGLLEDLKAGRTELQTLCDLDSKKMAA